MCFIEVTLCSLPHSWIFLLKLVSFSPRMQFMLFIFSSSTSHLYFFPLLFTIPPLAVSLLPLPSSLLLLHFFFYFLSCFFFFASTSSSSTLPDKTYKACMFFHPYVYTRLSPFSCSCSNEKQTKAEATRTAPSPPSTLVSPRGAAETSTPDSCRFLFTRMPLLQLHSWQLRPHLHTTHSPFQRACPTPVLFCGGYILLFFLYSEVHHHLHTTHSPSQRAYPRLVFFCEGYTLLFFLYSEVHHHL